MWGAFSSAVNSKQARLDVRSGECVRKFRHELGLCSLPSPPSVRHVHRSPGVNMGTNQEIHREYLYPRAFVLFENDSTHQVILFLVSCVTKTYVGSQL